MKLTIIQRLAINNEHRRLLYNALGKVALDGNSWHTALETMSAEFARTKHPLAPMTKAVLLGMRGVGPARPGQSRRTLGGELADMVPADEAMVIQAGETAGKMGEGLKNAASLVQSKARLTTAVRAALSNPAGYFCLLVLVLVYMSVDILPKFAAARPRVSWPENGQMLGQISDNVGLIVGAAVFLVAGGAAALQWVVPRWTGELRRKADAHIFPFTLIAEINGASFLKALAGYIASGTAFAEAVKNVALTSTPYMREQCGVVMELMRRGRRPEDALCQLTIIPSKYHWIIKVYAMSEDAAKVYEDIAEELTTSVEAFVGTLSGYVGTAMKLAVGLIVIWIYGALYDIAGA